MADERSAKVIVKLKMSVDEFGETCNLILDAFERGEPTVSTSLALKLVGHIQAVYQDTAKEIQALHDKYAHEGGIPQIMTKYVLLTWLAALNLPRVVDTTATNIPNVFYITFANKLTGSEEQQISALGITLTHVDGTHVRGHYMLKWNPPRSDEL